MAKLYGGHKMSAGFDPYLTWLSIHPEQQPPDRYRLLDLNRFESKPDVIENAMDGRLQFLAAFANGEHGEDCWTKCCRTPTSQVSRIRNFLPC